MIGCDGLINLSARDRRSSADAEDVQKWKAWQGGGRVSPPTDVDQLDCTRQPPISPMPPLPPADAAPRLIVYHQTHHDRSGTPISALPLIGSGVTHVYIAAIHLNDVPENITLNDHPPDHERNNHLWDEVKQLQNAGIKCLGMLGGAAQGSYGKLDNEVRTRRCH